MALQENDKEKAVSDIVVAETIETIDQQLTRLAKETPPFYKSHSLLILYMLIIPGCLMPAVTLGFNTAIINGLQAVPAWDECGRRSTSTRYWILTLISLSKVRCLSQRPGDKCKRCTSRNTACSYVHAPQHYPSPSSASPQSCYALQHETVGLDIGRGRPEEILREAQFAQSLLLLYFSNFGDVHFLFDEEVFLRRYALREVSEMVLFAMMALSIRFSVAPFREALSPAHRGEILFEHARSLVQEEWDRPSIAVAQAYVLLATYKLVYGGARQAFLYLGFAANMVKVLRLLDTSAEIDPVRLECSRRLASTVALMDRFVSLILRFPPHLIERIPTMMADDDFWALKRREPIMLCRKTSVSQEIVNLSELLVEVSRQNSNLAELRTSFRNRWADEPLQQYTTTNLEYHQQKDSLRSFLHMHILYHHIGRLLYFSNLGHECHAHARATADIVEYAWRQGDFDIHNYMAGQILTLASVVLSHALLIEPSTEDERRKQQCLDEWEAKTTTLQVFEKDGLLDEITILGSQFEKLDYRNAGRYSG
ncbi:conserved hypothetical protein [Verticillium alfalfae VaMs.102]|uniref:Xylanolytic transcriptional activator regulatory domain-containing protein n=1 Tax=Verticillium alfalfae (strain VaMs.102 / ATCC MYA-4576 / FGSC 10136) TaxID=526221 RepID=C9SDR5_VERA1|nr:conserved hypothetical protein [Verticillium alfalfae VaMs.102]EEY17185.1 conserved hypothetical protein [Verticillium alfalfae VaMs.102]